MVGSEPTIQRPKVLRPTPLRIPPVHLLVLLRFFILVIVLEPWTPLTPCPKVLTRSPLETPTFRLTSTVSYSPVVPTHPVVATVEKPPMPSSIVGVRSGPPVKVADEVILPYPDTGHLFSTTPPEKRSRGGAKGESRTDDLKSRWTSEPPCPRSIQDPNRRSVPRADL